MVHSYDPTVYKCYPLHREQHPAKRESLPAARFIEYKIWKQTTAGEDGAMGLQTPGCKPGGS